MTQVPKNISGRIFHFKPPHELSLRARLENNLDRTYQIHLVIVLGEFSYGKVNVVTITSHIDRSVDHRVYVPIHAPHWALSDDRPQLRFAGDYPGALPCAVTESIELPKPQSYVRLDSRRGVLFETLYEFQGQNGSRYPRLSMTSRKLLRSLISDAERDFISQSDWASSDVQETPSRALSAYMDIYRRVEKVTKEKDILYDLRNKDQLIAAVVDEYLKRDWLEQEKEVSKMLVHQEKMVYCAAHNFIDKKRASVQHQEHGRVQESINSQGAKSAMAGEEGGGSIQENHEKEMNKEMDGKMGKVGMAGHDVANKKTTIVGNQVTEDEKKGKKKKKLGDKTKTVQEANKWIELTSHK
ncbi:hypothetical protein V492_04154 [Pseudogymnoascus sp. VKM F-4246]|nr:hypothetical protein V492_04154 [Pseudogymnoascus sp. VKM F-4246]